MSSAGELAGDIKLRIGSRKARGMDPRLSDPYLDAPAVPELVARLRTTWPSDAPVLMVVDGAIDAIEVVTRSNVRLGDRVVVEDPCFPLLFDSLVDRFIKYFTLKQDPDHISASA